VREIPPTTMTWNIRFMERPPRVLTTRQEACLNRTAKDPRTRGVDA
jgi:hypothetical protein